MIIIITLNNGEPWVTGVFDVERVGGINLGNKGEIQGKINIPSENLGRNAQSSGNLA